jgi:hypothetical protein
MRKTDALDFVYRLNYKSVKFQRFGSWFKSEATPCDGAQQMSCYLSFFLT